MGVGLDALHRVPAQTEAVERVVADAERDVGVVADPGRADEQGEKDGQEDPEDEPVPARLFVVVLGHGEAPIVCGGRAAVQPAVTPAAPIRDKLPV
jgi:hypothetical protein